MSFNANSWMADHKLVHLKQIAINFLLDSIGIWKVLWMRKKRKKYYSFVTQIGNKTIDWINIWVKRKNNAFLSVDD
jgi:hypothetical protein